MTNTIPNLTKIDIDHLNAKSLDEAKNYAYSIRRLQVPVFATESVGQMIDACANATQGTPALVSYCDRSLRYGADTKSTVSHEVLQLRADLSTLMHAACSIKDYKEVALLGVAFLSLPAKASK